MSALEAPHSDKTNPTLTTRTQFRGSRFVLAGIVTVLTSAVAASAQEPPSVKFRNDRKLKTNEGHVSLAWTADGASLEYELQSAAGTAFENPSREYLGANDTFFLSGIPNGKYQFRVRARRPDGGDWGPWSESVELVCEHHPLSLAWTLFATGGLLFLATALFVVVNARSLNRFEGTDV